MIAERIERLTRSFDEQDAGLAGTDPLAFPGYAEQVAAARASSGRTEACVWGWAEIDGARCALVVFDFGFIGGSMGVAVGEKVARAFDAAARRRLPVVTVTASGGARMQEGMVALAQMAKTVEARTRHARGGLVHVSLLTSPTTGGVYASFASLADVILAEPHATVGFAGPRVVEGLTGSAPPAGVHRAEFALEHGLVDAIVEPADEPATIARILWSATPRHRGPSGSGGVRRVLRRAGGGDARPEPPTVSAWDRLQIARDPDRPKARQILDALFQSSFELRGDRSGAPDDGSVVVQIGGLRGRSLNVVAVAQDASGDARIRPQGFRKAIRGIELAGRLGLPVVTIVDTRGADPLPSSEGHGIASAIARTFAAMIDCPSPTVAAITGEGGSGGAMALAVADHVVALENAVFSVIAPDAAASILYRDPSKGPEIAERLGITAADLRALDLADEVVPEAGGPAPGTTMVDDLVEAVAAAVESLGRVRPRRRLRARRRRWRGAGNHSLGWS